MANLILTDRFKDPSSITFILVGDFDPDTIRPVIEKFIGGLPFVSRTEKSHFKNFFTSQGSTKVNLFGGEANKCLVDIVYLGQNNGSVKAENTGLMLSEVLKSGSGKCFVRKRAGYMELM